MRKAGNEEKPRNIAPRIAEALRDTPVVFLRGARQTGKSTLARAFARGTCGDWRGRYLTFDDAGVLSAAASDPAGFLAGLEMPVVLDEVQRVPDLFPALKREVDERRTPGRFFLTGSADVLLLPRVSESLAGRMEVLTLWPFSMGEREGRRETFLETIFDPRFSATAMSGDALGRRETFEAVLCGGYPEAVARADAARRAAWFGSYLTTILERDVRDLAAVERWTDLPRLLALLAARAGGLLNLSELSRTSGVPLTTLRRYLTLFETTFLVRFLPAWSGNLGKRLAKTPKVFFADTGLAAHLLGAESEEVGPGATRTGALLENFVAMELVKQASWSRKRVRLYHYRDVARREVDLLIEDGRGRIVGIEVKASAAVSRADFKALEGLGREVGKRFVRGIVLYTGRDAVPFGGRLHALPISAVWK